MLFHLANLLTISSMILALEPSYSHELKGLVPGAPDIPGIVLCAGTFPKDSTCSQLTLTDGTCYDFTGKLKTFHKALTGAQITTGYICKLYKNLGCDNAGPTTYVVLRGGSYDLATVMVPDGDGTLINFNKQASSILCNLVP